MSKRETVTVRPYLMALRRLPEYQVSLTRAEVLVARGQARWLDTGLRQRVIVECRPTVARGELRSWRKVTNRSRSGAALYSTMQLVPGVSQGRNTGARHGSGSIRG